MRPRSILVTLSILVAAGGALALDASTPDTVLVLGGPDRWDGRFETPEGEPDWHGWTHADLHGGTTDIRWHVSDHLPLAGQYSMWCGTWFENACADGYGNGWRQSLVFEWPATDPNVATTVRWQAIARVDSEEGYDFFHVQVRRGATWQDILTPFSGGGDMAIDVTWVIAPADYVEGYWQLRFYAISDNAWSDEDCLYDSRGFARVDDISVTVDGVVVSSEDFESQPAGDWKPLAHPLVGDFTALWSGLDTFDPDPLDRNHSWQVAFIDDGLVVPGTGGSPCNTWCYGPDGWTFNVTAGLTAPSGAGVGPFGPLNAGAWNAVTSPTMSWPENADAGEIAFDVYAHMQYYECGLTTYGWSLRATSAEDPAELAAAAWQPTRWSYYNQEAMPAGPGYYRIAMRLDDLLPATARWVQVRLEAHEAGPWCWGDHVWDATPAPYFDNVAVRAWSTLTAVPPAAPPLALGATPNPFNPRVALRWQQPSTGRVDLAIHDARGRLVRQLLAEDRPAGSGEAIWDGRDDGGAAVSAGVYLARLRTAAGTKGCKLSLIR